MIKLNNLSFNSLYEKLKTTAETQKAEKLATFPEDAEKTGKYHDFLQQKLEYIPEIQSIKPELQRKFLELFIAVNEPNRKDSTIVSLVATYAALINLLNVDLELLTENQSIMLASAMSSIPLYDYDMYGEVLSNQKLLSSVEASATDTNDQLDIFDEMLDMLDEVAYPDMSQEEYDATIAGCIKIATSFVPQKSKELT